MIRFSGKALLLFLLVFAAGVTYADKVEIRMYKLSAAADFEMEIGSVTAEDTPYGLLLSPFLDELEPGPHGFHIHQNPDCCAKEKDGSMVPGLGAGGHFDPAGTGAHLGPYQDGHLGDLPVLWVGSDGKARTPVLAPRVKVSDLKGRSLMIHAEGDNYSDTPRKLGGGGARTACGVVP